MAGTIRRGKIVRADLALWDGLTSTYSRIDATGGTVTGLTIGNEVDVLQIYGAGINRTRGTIADAIQQIGTAEVDFIFAPGSDWDIDDDLTIPSNITCHIPRGCVFSVDSGKTLTFAGPVYAGSSSFYSGSGTTVLSVDSIVGGKVWIARTAAEISASKTPTNHTYPELDLRRYGGGVGVAAATNATAIASATAVAAAAGGGTVIFPVGQLDCNAQLIPLTNVVWQGAGKYATVLNCTAIDGAMAGNIFIDARGTGIGGFPADRKIISITDMTILGVDAGDNVKCIAFGWNMRSMPLLARVKIQQFGHYGYGFIDQNWNISFEDLEIDRCGGRVTNSCGVYKDPAVDSGTFNYITHTRCQIESCGSASSTAGGLNLQTNTANRGLYFTDCIVEGNFGTDEIYISNTSDVQFKNIYMERENVSGQTTGIELAGCTGAIHGGYVTGTGSNNTLGIKIKDSSDMEISAVTMATWATASIDIEGANVRVGRNPGATYQLDSTAQISGAVKPSVSAHKNGTDQTGIATATPTKVTFGTERYDETGAFASSTFTPRTIGNYVVKAAVNFKTAVDQTRMAAMIYVNGAAYKSTTIQASGTGAHTVVVTADVDINATTDTIEIYARQDSGSNKDISGVADETYFMATLVK